MRLRTRLVLGVPALALAVSLPACKSEPAPAEKPAAPVAAPTPPAPPVPAAPQAPASASGQSQADCIAPFSTEGEARELALGQRKAKITGSVLEVLEPDADQAVTFGLIANLKEPTGENLFNVGRYLEFFAAEKVEAILVAGDTGETQDAITRLLEPLAKSGLPTFVIPGNREARADFTAALDALGAKYPNLVNMSKVRLAKFDDASLVSLPGYYDKRYIHLGDAGCQYFKEDVDALAGVVKAAAQPAVLLSHAEFHGQGREALDAFPDGNAGDSNLTAFLKAHPVPFGVFANIHEAGGRASDLNGNLAKEGEAQEKLFVNVGLGDSTPWKLNDGTWSYGMVATLKIDGGKGSYKTFRAKQLTEEEQAKARELEPATAAAAE